MIGAFRIEAPAPDDEVRQRLDDWLAEGHAPGFLLVFGSPDRQPDPALRLAAGYLHLLDAPDDGPAWLEVVRQHSALGEFDAAHAILDEIERLGAPELYPGVYAENPAIHRLHLLIDAGDLENAEALAQNLADEFGDSTVFHHTLAGARHDAGRFADARSAYDDALATLDRQRDDDFQDDDIDFDAVGDYLRALRDDAENNRPFRGVRAFALADLVAPTPEPEEDACPHHGCDCHHHG